MLFYGGASPEIIMGGSQLTNSIHPITTSLQSHTSKKRVLWNFLSVLITIARPISSENGIFFYFISTKFCFYEKKMIVICCYSSFYRHCSKSLMSTDSAPSFLNIYFIKFLFDFLQLTVMEFFTNVFPFPCPTNKDLLTVLHLKFIRRIPEWANTHTTWKNGKLFLTFFDVCHRTVSFIIIISMAWASCTYLAFQFPKAINFLLHSLR